MQICDVVNYYKDSYNNLLLAILIQAAEDAKGYHNNLKYYDGSDAVAFLKDTGKIIYSYLEEQQKWHRHSI